MKQKSKSALEKAAYRAKHPEKAKAQSIRDRANRTLHRRLFEKAKRRAKIYNVPFTIRASDIVIPAMCPILGIPLVRRGDAANAATLDRIIPRLGYIPGNITVISHRANRLKSDASVEEVRAVLRFLETALKMSGA